MPIIVQTVSSLDRPIITAALPEIDDCTLFQRTKVFIIDKGVQATLEHVWRDRNGEVKDLNDYVGHRLAVRSREGIGVGRAHVYETEAVITDPDNGIVQAPTVPEFTAKAGIYILQWGIFDDEDCAILTDSSLLIVERSLFGIHYDEPQGPPRFQEIRMAMYDTPGDNFLLSRVEFSDDQLAEALLRPVRFWNEVPPPIRPLIDTTNFPYQEHWLKGTKAHLMTMAAHNYRREHLPYNAGGVAVDDKNKEQEYMRYAMELKNEYEEFVKLKKMQINTGLCVGVVQSEYGVRFY